MLLNPELVYSRIFADSIPGRRDGSGCRRSARFAVPIFPVNRVPELPNLTTGLTYSPAHGAMGRLNDPVVIAFLNILFPNIRWTGFLFRSHLQPSSIYQASCRGPIMVTGMVWPTVAASCSAWPVPSCRSAARCSGWCWADSRPALCWWGPALPADGLR